MQADDHNIGARDDTALAMALAQAVRAVGRTLAADPRRVQAMVRDVLGSDSRARRAEIDAVVLAAEEAVPEDLLAERIDVAAAVDRLSDRGLAPDVSLFAVAVWRYALGLLAENAEPPTLTNSLEQSSDPVPTGAGSATRPAAEPSTERGLDAVSSQPTDIAEPTHQARPLPQPTPLDPRGQPVQGAGAGAVETRRRFWLPAVALVAVLAATLVFVFTRGGSGELVASPLTDPTVAATSPAPSTTVSPSTSAAPTSAAPSTSAPSTAAAPTTAPPVEAAPPLPTAQFAPEPTNIGDATRTWTAEGQQLTGVVQIANPTDAAAVGWYYEVLPKSMVASLDQIAPLDPNVPFFPFLTDPVVRYFVDIPPDAAVTVGYVVTLPVAPTQVEIDAWKAEQEAAHTEFRTAVPALTIDTAQGGVVASSRAEVTGTAPGAAVVTINGTEVEGFELFDGSGRWWHPLSGLRTGSNEFTIVATSPHGEKTSATWTVNYRPPTTTTTPRRSNGGGGGGGGGGTPEPPPPTTTTLLPVPPPP